MIWSRTETSLWTSGEERWGRSGNGDAEALRFAYVVYERAV